MLTNREENKKGGVMAQDVKGHKRHGVCANSTVKSVQSGRVVHTTHVTREELEIRIAQYS